MYILATLTTAWKYETKCTTNVQSSSLESAGDLSYSIVDDFENIISPRRSNQQLSNKMLLKCPNSNDFLFIGSTQYGVSSSSFSKSCEIKSNDCLVNIDYLASQCNGLNSCDIQLDAQFLHTCKNFSDYLSIAYECITGSKRIDICSNEETFVIDSTFSKDKSDVNSRFGSFYLASPNYPSEYDSNLKNCSCQLEYVEIDGSNAHTNQMNLELKTYEFDLEEEENKRCNNDKLIVSGNGQVQELCGQHKDFKEFSTTGSQVKFNLTTNDAITRRGFLIEVTPTHETICPYGTSRFKRDKCVKLYDNQHLTYRQATKACSSQSGRLLKINDFVDNFKLNSFIQENIDKPTFSIWSNFIATNSKDSVFLNVKKRRNTPQNMACISRTNSFWMEKSCFTKLPYICEFEAIKVRKNVEKVENNKLIRVSCGKLITKFANVVKTTVSTTTMQKAKTLEPITKSKQSKEKPVLLWSSLVKTIVPSKVELKNEESELNEDISYDLESNAMLDDIQMKTTVNDEGPFSQKLILIVAIVCGAALVFIMINVFCIWNYYKKKLDKFIEKSDVESSTYRTSTMKSGVPKHLNQDNTNRSMSTVDSYVKMLPGCAETCLLNNENTSLTWSMSSNQLKQQQQMLEYDVKLDILRNYFQNKQLGNQSNFYETISSLKKHNTDKAYQSHIDMSIMQAIQNQQMQQQIYEQIAYSDVSPTLSMNSQMPLITFANGLSKNSLSKVDDSPI